MKIFILEDNKARIDFFAKEFFFDSSIELIVATDIDNAIKSYEKNKDFDFVFLDHDLDNQVFADSNKENTGAEFVRYLIKNHEGKNSIYLCHSLNTVGRAYMFNTLKDYGYNAYNFDFMTILKNKGRMKKILWALKSQSVISFRDSIE